MKTLHLLAAPPSTMPTGDLVFALTNIAGVPLLASADRALHYDENMEQAALIAAQAKEMATRADLTRVFTAHNLPPVESFRLCYPQIKPPCRVIVDLLARLDALRQSQSFAALHFVGPNDWRCAALEAWCAARDAKFSWMQSAPSRRAQSEERARIARAALWVLRDRKHNFRVRRGDDKTEFLFFAGLTRMMLGLAPVLRELRGQNANFKVVDMYNDRIEALCGALPGGVWRLNGDAPLLPSTHRGDRDLRRAIDALPDATQNLDEAVTWRGVLLNGAMKVVFRDAMARAVSHTQAVQRLLDANPNALAIGTNENEQVLEVARAANRAVAVVQTSALAEYHRILPGRGTYLAMSRADVAGLEKLGVEKEKTVVCGHAYYDELARRDARAEAAQWRARLGISAERRVFLLLDVYAVPGLLEPETREDIFRAIHRGLAPALRETNGVLVVKLRPGQSARGLSANEDLHAQWARDAGIPDSQIMVSRESLVFPFIAGCDALISCDSTAGIEAILLDKDMISWPLSGSDPFGYTATGASARVQSADETERAALDLVRDKDARERLAQGRAFYRAEYLHALDGQVVSRQAAALREARRKITPE